MSRSLFFVAAALALTPFTPARAAESLATCANYIDALPAVVSTQGTWCLRANLAMTTSADAIVVNAANVTIDCNGFGIDGTPVGAATTGRGIAVGGVANTTVRNCTVRGFKYGMWAIGAGSGHLVENNRFDGNTSRALALFGDNHTVRGNHITRTGGGPDIIPPETPTAVLLMEGAGVTFTGNTISGVAGRVPGTPQSNRSAVAISLINTNGVSIVGNQISGLAPVGDGFAVGISASFSTGVAIRDNELFGPGTANSIALPCDGTTSVVRGNTTVGFVADAPGCVDGGGNVHID